MIDKKDYYFRDKLAYETCPHYTYMDDLTDIGLHFDDEEMNVNKLEYEVNGKKKVELDEISRIYGIEGIERSYVMDLQLHVFIHCLIHKKN